MNPTIKVAEQFPQTKFDHATGYKTAANVGTYNARFYEGRYLAGQVAGQDDEIERCRLCRGVPDSRGRDGNQRVHAWHAQRQCGRAGQGGLDQLVRTTRGERARPRTRSSRRAPDVLTHHTDSTAVVQAAEAKKVYAIAYHSDMSKYGPHAQLTAVTHQWGDYYTKTVRDAIAGTWKPGAVWGGLKEGMIRMAPMNPAVPAERSTSSTGRPPTSPPENSIRSPDRSATTKAESACRRARRCPTTCCRRWTITSKASRASCRRRSRQPRLPASFRRTSGGFGDLIRSPRRSSSVSGTPATPRGCAPRRRAIDRRPPPVVRTRRRQVIEVRTLCGIGIGGEAHINPETPCRGRRRRARAARCCHPRIRRPRGLRARLPARDKVLQELDRLVLIPVDRHACGLDQDRDVAGRSLPLGQSVAGCDIELTTITTTRFTPARYRHVRAGLERFQHARMPRLSDTPPSTRWMNGRLALSSRSCTARAARPALPVAAGPRDAISRVQAAYLCPQRPP